MDFVHTYANKIGSNDAHGCQQSTDRKSILLQTLKQTLMNGGKLVRN